jgi:hypothetical protein
MGIPGIRIGVMEMAYLLRYSAAAGITPKKSRQPDLNNGLLTI